MGPSPIINTPRHKHGIQYTTTKRLQLTACNQRKDIFDVGIR